MELAQSFASLVKINNGFFKSEKQAQFLLSMINGQGGNSYITCGNVWGNSFNMEYFCDNKGVTKVTKYSKAKGTLVEWTRKVEGEVSVQDAKAIKRLTRAMNDYKKKIASRQASWDAGTYDAPRELFEIGMQCDQEGIDNCAVALQKYL